MSAGFEPVTQWTVTNYRWGNYQTKTYSIVIKILQLIQLSFKFIFDLLYE